MANQIDEMLEKLEIEFVDEYSLSTTLNMLSDICRLKAIHIQENWETIITSVDLPKRWRKLASDIEEFTEEIEVEANALQGL